MKERSDHADDAGFIERLVQALFPDWFAGFAFAAIAIGALVPAAVMSIGSANLFTRNFWKAYVNPEIDPAPALFVGWAVGMAGGTYMAWSDGMKPLHILAIGDASFTAYVGLIALVANIVVAGVVNLAMILRQPTRKS
jgi:solute:Na+ symporter, SSS family